MSLFNIQNLLFNSLNLLFSLKNLVFFYFWIRIWFYTKLFTPLKQLGLRKRQYYFPLYEVERGVKMTKKLFSWLSIYYFDGLWAQSLQKCPRGKWKESWIYFTRKLPKKTLPSPGSEGPVQPPFKFGVPQGSHHQDLEWHSWEHNQVGLFLVPASFVSCYCGRRRSYWRII
jgi:hypothetical protein